MKAGVISLLALVAALAPGTAPAQESGDLILGAGGGVTYYCIVSRCDTGATLLGLAGYGPWPFLMVSGSGRWHDCFDCGRFVIAEASLQLRRPAGTVQPFVGAGAGLSSDPELMGDRFGLHGAIGAWMWPTRQWGLQAELKGRTLGGGDRMGEASLALTRRFPSR